MDRAVELNKVVEEVKRKVDRLDPSFHDRISESGKKVDHLGKWRSKPKQVLGVLV